MALTTGRQDQMAVTVEVTAGTLVAPVADGSGVIRTLSNSANRAYQPVENLISQERKNTLGVDALIRDADSAGEMDFTTYLKGTGTAGTPPPAGYRACLKGTYGRETVTGGTSVKYEHLRIDTDTRLTYSVFKKFSNNMVLQCAGTLFNMLDVAIRQRGNEALLQARFSGPFMRRFWAGQTATIATPTATTIPVTTGTAKYFAAGSYVEVVGSTPLPVKITSIDYTTDVLTVPTISPVPGAGVLVKGYFPTPAAETGFIISGWRGMATLGGVNFCHREIDYHVDNKIAIPDDIRCNTPYLSDFVEGEDFREVTYRVNHYYAGTPAGGADKWYDADAEIQKAIIVPVGNVAGRIYTFASPKIQLVNPPEESTDGRVMITLNYRALETTTGNDESYLLLT